MSKIELLAPAGNFACLAAAVQSGADAVYFSGKEFGARSYAQNFTNDEIKSAIEYCRLRGVKTHIAVNTAYTDVEIQRVLEFVEFLYKEGADALIVSDAGLISEIKRNFPDFSVHASTQMTIHSLDGVRFAENLGADRIVLSRELSFDEIEYISSHCSAEIEIFVHGALCMSYSGQCLLSSMIGGRSGNRGSCAQPCRLPFCILPHEKKFILSLKDLSLVNHIKKIKNLKVASLKIEGRMKGPQYVAAVVSIYRKYLDGDTLVSKSDQEILESVFYRGGFTDGYFTGKKGREMFTFDKPDNPYLKQSKTILSDFDKDFLNIEQRKIDLFLYFSAAVGKKAKVIVKNENTEVVYEYEKPCSLAENKAADEEYVKAQLLKTGGTPFNISECKINIGENVFLSKAELNEIRRNAIKLFEEKLINIKKRTFDSVLQPNDDFTEENVFSDGYTAYVSTLLQLKALEKYDFLRIYVPFELCNDIFLLNDDIKKRIVLSLPEIIFDSELRNIERIILTAKENGICTLLINNPAQLKYSKDFKLILSHRFNIWNSRSLKTYKEKYNIEAAQLSPELSFKTINKMNKPIETEFIAYGHIPVMLTENCIIKNAGVCPCGSDFLYVTDRKGMKFPVRKSGNSCRSILYNSLPVYLADKKPQMSKTGCIKNLYFTCETPEDVKSICDAYLESGNYIPHDFTRGHYLK